MDLPIKATRGSPHTSFLLPSLFKYSCFFFSFLNRKADHHLVALLLQEVRIHTTPHPTPQPQPQPQHHTTHSTSQTASISGGRRRSSSLFASPTPHLVVPRPSLRSSGVIEDIVDLSLDAAMDQYQMIETNEEDGKSFLDAAEARLELEKLRESANATIEELKEEIEHVRILPLPRPQTISLLLC